MISNTLTGISNNDGFGYSLSVSSDKNIMAVGSYTENNYTGYVKVYEYNGISWIQKGNTIYGEKYYDRFGHSVSLSSNGSILAVGAYCGSDYTGYVKVYEYNGTSWIQKGNTTIGYTNSGEQFGSSVSLSSNGNILGVGAFGYNSSRGYVNIYEYSSSSWVQKGNTLTGEYSNDRFGCSVSLSSNGNIIGIGAYNSNSITGSVKIYEYSSSSWTQKGSTLTGKSSDDLFGFSVSLSSNGNTVAIGAPVYNGIGYVNIYEYSSSSWTQKGDTLLGEFSNDSFGFSVSLSGNGNIVAVGAYNANIDINNYFKYSCGYAKIYQHTTSWIQKGRTLTGNSGGDFFGYSVSLSSNGNLLGVGAFNANHVTGYAKIYHYSFDIINPTSTSNGPFSYTSSNVNVATISGNTVTIVGVGSTTISLIQAAYANYTSVSADAQFTVTVS